MVQDKLIVIGSNDLLEMVSEIHDILGYISPKKESNSIYQSFEYLGNDAVIKNYQKSNFVLGISDGKRRKDLYKVIEESGNYLHTFIDKRAVVFKSSKIDSGSIISPLVTVSSNAIVEKSVIVNYGALVGHDVQVGRFSFIGAGVKILNSVTIGEKSIIGANCTVLPGIKIGSNVKVAPNVVINKNIPDNKLIIPTQASFRALQNE